MSTSEEIRLMTKVVDEYVTHIGVTDIGTFVRVLHSALPRDGYRGLQPVDAMLRQALDALVRKTQKESVANPANFVLKVWRDLVNGKDVPRDSRPSTHSSPSPTSADAELLAEIGKDIEEAERRLRANPACARRQLAIEHWRDTRFTNNPAPTPHWALYGYDSPEQYRDKMLGADSMHTRAPVRSMEAERPKMPRRGLAPLDEAIDGSRELRDQSELNE